MNSPRKIVFLTERSKYYPTPYHYYNETSIAIEMGYDLIATTNLDFISFDLFDQGFNSIEIEHKGIIYDLKLGENNWTYKHLRKEHNLYKLVRNNILNK
jgi:hypothetical protein